jgi:cobalt-precorrin 5A hydrolase / precorrin-3B C17-methyltransferase
MTAGAPAIVVLGRRSAETAYRLKRLVPGAAIHAPATDRHWADEHFASAVDHLRGLFGEGRPVVGVCASGILIRALAPLLGDKLAEPPVVAVAEDGSAVVPLLGGHRGANELAERLAAALGVKAAVTTASDARLGTALDEPPRGWRLHNPEHVKGFVRRLLDGEPVRLRVEAGDAGWLRSASLPLAEGAALELLVTARPALGSPERLVYHPPVLAVGVGSEFGVPADALLMLLEEACEEHGLATGSVAVVASIELKSAEPAVHALAQALGADARFFPVAALREETHRLTARSETVFRETGCWGVAEAAALAAVGPEGRLLVPKRKGARVTCAVAVAARDLDLAAIGRPRGRLAVVGLGPGDPRWQTREVADELDQAEELVGYDRYLDLLPWRYRATPQRRFPLGEEVERCRYALVRAAAGTRVALVCSGDPGIYALATLVLELLDKAEDDAWSRVELVVCPGVSALQAAAALAGAPLGHDFCAISLSDLLTPLEMIERRVRAAAESDLVVALFNPVSARRREALARARDILLERRPEDTPVVIARNVGRPEEQVRLVGLAELTPDLCDMLTIVLVGSSATRRTPRLHGPDWVYTPRGYDVR